MQLFINNWATMLTAPAGASAGTFSVPLADAAKLTGLGAGDHYLLTLAEVDGNGLETAWETVKVTASAAGVLTALRLGIVLALATQWSAYQAFVYNVVIGGPAELATALSGTGEDRPEALPARVEGSYQALEALAHPRPIMLPAAPPQSGAAVAPLQSRALLFGALTVEEQKRLSTSSVVMLVSSLGALLSVRVAAGLLLALDAVWT